MGILCSLLCGVQGTDVSGTLFIAHLPETYGRIRLTSKNPLEGFALSGVLADFRSRLSDVFPTYPTCDYLLESKY